MTIDTCKTPNIFVYTEDFEAEYLHQGSKQRAAPASTFTFQRYSDP